MVNVFINQNMRFRVDYNERRYRILTPRCLLYTSSLFVINIRKPYRNLWEAEKKLNNYVDDLERSVTQRTKEIRKANEKLVKNLKDAQHIQRALMTTEFPKIPGMEFAAKYLPCEQVGGDFYSVFRLDEQNIGILIGDVAEMCIRDSLPAHPILYTNIHGIC